MLIPIPSERPEKYFNIDDPIYVWLPSKKSWFFGNVRSGYRTADGFVSYRLLDIGPQDEDIINPTKLFWWYKYWGIWQSSPHILKDYEYDYFQNYPLKYSNWCKVAYSESEKNGEGRPQFAVIPGTESYFAKMILNF